MMMTDAGVPSLQRYTINKGGLLAYAATFAPGIFQVRRTTWVAAGIGLLALVAGLIWAAVILLGWLVGMAQTAPDAALRTLKQVEEKIPTARERLGDSLPALAPVARGMLDRLDSVVFAAPVFDGGEPKRAVHRGLSICGMLCLAGAVGPSVGNMRLQSMGILGYAVVLPVVCVLLARVFRRGRGAKIKDKG